MSNTDRKTKEIKTTGGHTAVLVEYITGREKREITEIFFGAMALANGDKSAITRPGTMNSADDKAIQIVVRSLDGSTENILERILDLPVEDYTEISDAVAEVANSKKKSTTS